MPFWIICKESGKQSRDIHLGATHQAADEKTDQLPTQAQSIHPETAYWYKTKTSRTYASTVAPDVFD